MSSEAAFESAITECARVVQSEDPDRFLCLVQLQKRDRPKLAALFAFQAEIAKTREVVSEPAVGEIRLQWWRETVESLFEGNVRQHYVAQALHPVVQGPLAEDANFRDQLISLIDAREADLYDGQPSDLDALEDYARSTSGELQALAAAMLEGGAQAQQAARHVGIAWAICGLIRALPYHANEGRLMLPRTLMEEEGLVNPARPDEEQMQALAAILQRLEAQARAHIAKARALRTSVSARERPLLRLAPLAEGYFASLKKAGYDPEGAAYDRGALGRQMRLMGKVLSRSF